jgi:glycosyltransferase involved in cell wall biosynthesis
MTAQELSDEIQAHVAHGVAELTQRYFPGFYLPRIFNGFAMTDDVRADWAYVLGYLQAGGLHEVGGCQITEAIRRVLHGIDGPATQVFSSYRVAECLLHYGPFVDNPLLETLSEAEKRNLAAACDSSSIYDPATGFLSRDPARRSRLPSNYYAVLARCEEGRRRLGLLPDPTIAEAALAKTRQLFERSELGFLDDSLEGAGRYDIYSADMLLFVEPLAEQVGPSTWRQSLQRHVQLLETMALPNGSSFAWGRSTGVLSICLTLELAGAALRHGVASSPERMVGLARHAFRQLTGWFEEGLITAHKNRSPYRYRGPHRRLQLTLDCLGKIAYAAAALRDSQFHGQAEERLDRLFPDCDSFVSFDRRPTGLWVFRNRFFDFQYAFVPGNNADYVPAPRSPGFLENPVDSPLLTWVPRILANGKEYTVAGLPTHLHKTTHGFSATWSHFAPADATDHPPPLAGERKLQVQVKNRSIEIDETWRFDTPPDGISLAIPEAHRPLQVQVQEHSGPFRQWSAQVAGNPAWRSFWGEIQRVYEFDFTPASLVQLRFRVRPRLRVITTPGTHDYVRALYNAMPENEIQEIPIESQQSLDQPGLIQALTEADVLHLGWPEHLITVGDRTAEAYLRDYLALIAEIRQRPIRVVWTLHNRLPHRDAINAATSATIYRAWAETADALIHHSHWGLQTMKAEWQFRADARHAVIPHGHYGEVMGPDLPATRCEAEKRLGLSPSVLRFGVIGRPQPEKQVGLIMNAFTRTTQSDRELLVTALLPEDTVPEDRRIRTIPRTGWLSRSTLTHQLTACDALIAANSGDRYLTSGQVADAIGLGIPMIVPEWEFFREILGDAAIVYGTTEDDLRRCLEGLSFAEIERAAAAARALQKNYAWEQLARQTLDLFEQLDQTTVD